MNKHKIEKATAEEANIKGNDETRNGVNVLENNNTTKSGNLGNKYDGIIKRNKIVEAMTE